MRGQPRIQRRERFLEQGELHEPRVARGMDSQLTRFLVERCWNREDDVLLLEAECPTGSGVRVVPRVAEVCEDAGRGVDW